MEQRNRLEESLRPHLYSLVRGDVKRIRAGVKDVSFNCPGCKHKVTFDLVLKEQTAKIFLNWLANEIRQRARSNLGAEFPADAFQLGCGGEVELENLAEPLHFHLHIVASTKKQPVIEFVAKIMS